MSTAPTENYEDQPRGMWTRIKEKFGFGAYDEYYDEDNEPIPMHGAPVRLHTTRRNKVSVWMNVTSLDQAQSAADGLKQSHQQIVNLEKASQEVSTRVIDFLSGVTYALDGETQKVGEKVYMFTPRNYEVERDNGGGKRTSNMFSGN